MPTTKATPQTLFNANTVVPANTTRTAPVVGTVIDCTGGYGAGVHLQITNGVAPSSSAVIELQISPDGVNLWTFFDQIAGDITSSSVNTGTIIVPKEAGFVRAIAYGNNTNPVTVNGQIVRVTGM